MMKLRPHHILDILRTYGHGTAFVPHPYGHALHTVAQSILSDLSQEIELIVGADAICQPCQHLQPDGTCDDILHQLEIPLSKQTYNDTLDRRLFSYLGLTPGTVISIQRFCEIVHENIPGIEAICTHPHEHMQYRLNGLIQGLQKLGMRKL
jgi:hypothetical protein